MSKFTSENWHSGPLGLPAYVQMGEQGGFQLKRSDGKNHEAANLIAAALNMRNDLELLRDHLAFLKGDDYELVVQADKTLAKADGKGE